MDLKKLCDAQNIADQLADLPQEALLYIAGYAEGFRDRPKRRRKGKTTGGENKPRS